MWNIFPHDPFVSPAHAFGLAIFFPFFFIIAMLWSVVWKALALWHASRNKQRIWFLVLLVVNTVGILEIVYLIWFRKNRNGEGSNDLFPFLKDWHAKAKEKMGRSSSSEEAVVEKE